MKYILLFILLISINFNSYSQLGNQLRNTKVIMKSGDTLEGFGKKRNKGFKFKKSLNLKEKGTFIDFSKIDYIQQFDSNQNVHIFKFLQILNSKKYIQVEELIDGPVELYITANNYTSTLAGGVSYNMTSVKYYLKRKEDTKLTKIGTYGLNYLEYQSKVNRFFSDCPQLIQQLENKNLRYKDGLERIVHYYNNNCTVE